MNYDFCDVPDEADVGCAGRMNNRGITSDSVTVLRNSVGANKRARNRIQKQLSEVSFIDGILMWKEKLLSRGIPRSHCVMFELLEFVQIECF